MAPEFSLPYQVLNLFNTVHVCFSKGAFSLMNIVCQGPTVWDIMRILALSANLPRC